MLRRLLMSGALVASALVAPTALGAPAGAAVLSATHSAAASCYKRVGNHWNCVTPGAYCPAAAHNRYGYTAAKVRYKCVKYSNGRWRWKRA